MCSAELLAFKLDHLQYFHLSFCFKLHQEIVPAVPHVGECQSTN